MRRVFHQITTLEREKGKYGVISLNFWLSRGADDLFARENKLPLEPLSCFRHFHASILSWSGLIL